MDEDRNLVENCLAGNEDAIEEFVRRYQRMVYAFAYRMINDMEEAKDITQKTFIQAIKGLKGFKQRASLKTWLYRIAMNVTLNHMRRYGQKDVEFDESTICSQSGVLSVMIEHERDSLIKKGLERLPEQQRLAIVLRTYESLSCQEAGMIMGCSEGAVKAHYHHGVKKLREFLRERGYEVQTRRDKRETP